MMKIDSPTIGYFALVALVATLFSPTIALAQEASPSTSDAKTDQTVAASEKSVEAGEEEAEQKEKEEEEEKDSDQSIGLSASLSLAIGQGTFSKLGNVDGKRGSNTTDNDLRDPVVKSSQSRFPAYADMTLGVGVGASYSYKDHSVRMGIGATQFLIGAPNQPYDFTIGDLGISYGWAGYKFDAINSRISAGAGLSLPTSVRSRENNVIAAVNAGVNFSTRIIDSFGLSFGLRAGKIFNQYNGQVQRNRFDKNGYPTVIARENQQIGGNQATVGGVPTEWSLGLSGGLSWSIWVLNMGVNYSFSNAWSYKVDVGKDDVSKITNVDGKRFVKSSGRRWSQSMAGSVYVSYSPTVWWLKGVGFSLSLSNGQAPKTSDQKSFRFPFWNFEGANAGASAVVFNVSYGYNIPL